jgi:DedD protein
LRAAGIEPAGRFDSAREALVYAQENAGEDDRILAFGSFLTVAAALQVAWPVSVTTMAEKDTSPDADLQLKKRARRRLVGAAALALFAVIVLPMVMDREPRPMTQDIQVRIPSQDSTASGPKVLARKACGDPDAGTRTPPVVEAPAAAAKSAPDPVAPRPTPHGCGTGRRSGCCSGSKARRKAVAQPRRSPHPPKSPAPAKTSSRTKAGG